jgi:hypothetical protein
MLPYGLIRPDTDINLIKTVGPSEIMVTIYEAKRCYEPEDRS